MLSAFDPKNESHVMWLKAVDDAMHDSVNMEKVNLQEVVNSNPMKVKVSDMMEWAFIHFQLALKYTQAVLKCEAFVPSKK
jgi:hypothetical protein